MLLLRPGTEPWHAGSKCRQLARRILPDRRSTVCRGALASVVTEQRCHITWRGGGEGGEGVWEEHTHWVNTAHKLVKSQQSCFRGNTSSLGCSHASYQTDDDDFTDRLEYTVTPTHLHTEETKRSTRKIVNWKSFPVLIFALFPRSLSAAITHSPCKSNLSTLWRKSNFSDCIILNSPVHLFWVHVLPDWWSIHRENN